MKFQKYGKKTVFLQKITSYAEYLCLLRIEQQS